MRISTDLQRRRAVGAPAPRPAAPASGVFLLAAALLAPSPASRFASLPAPLPEAPDRVSREVTRAALGQDFAAPAWPAGLPVAVRPVHLDAAPAAPLQRRPLAGDALPATHAPAARADVPAGARAAGLAAAGWLVLRLRPRRRGVRPG